MSFLSELLELCVRKHSASEVVKELHYAIMADVMSDERDKRIAAEIWEVVARLPAKED